MDRRIPTSSQTVGPFFTIGLNYLIDRMVELDDASADWIEIRGRVMDRDGAPVPDAMLEFWSAGAANKGTEAGLPCDPIPNGFRRVSTDLEGCFAFKIAPPVSSRLDDGRQQAPHFLVLVFARGLQRHLISRAYLEGEGDNDSDPVLHSVSDERRKTLIASRSGAQLYHWNVILQGVNETVFFAW